MRGWPLRRASTTRTVSLPLNGLGHQAHDEDDGSEDARAGDGGSEVRHAASLGRRHDEAND